VRGLAARYRAFGLVMTAGRIATQEEIDTAHSSLARRMGAGLKRPAWLIGFTRCGPAPRSVGQAHDVALRTR
jgi:hypothetical protein